MGRHADEHLRRFLLARAAGDAAGMREYWEELVIDFKDRIDGFVAAAHVGRLNDEEHELAVALEPDPLLAAADRTPSPAARWASWSTPPRRSRAASASTSSAPRSATRRHRGPSLDAGWDLADGPEHGWEAAESARRHDEAERSAEVRDFLEWALPQIGEDRRRVLELTFRGAELPEIMEELGITRDNAYQRRSRAMRDLKRLKEQYDR